MTAYDWVLRLHTPTPHEQQTPAACSPQTLAAAAADLGPGPVQWAVDTAAAMTRRVIERVPEHGDGPGPTLTLRRAVESGVLTALITLRHDRAPSKADIPPDTVDSDREFARRGIPLDRVLRAIRVGHAELARELAAAIEREVPPGDQLSETQRINERLFDHVDMHASVMAEEYIAERDRWSQSKAAARRALVDRILAGTPIGDSEEAEVLLGYPVHRYHLACILWPAVSDPPDTSETKLRAAVADIAHTIAGAATLTVPAEASITWLWIGLPRTPTSGLTDLIKATLTSHPDIRAALGIPAHGLAGMRQSHLCAREAGRLALLSGNRICDYRSVRLAALITTDQEQARWFVDSALGPLAAHDPRTTKLRETLQCYLANGRSLITTAEQLHIARNTVAYRVKSAEARLGRTTGTDELELRAALEVTSRLGHALWQADDQERT
ncbi:helix-turn-helix domain-containing protein [Streptomyces sp. NPDC001093]|uniref:PucR family transcriptional regulator n=1 Tax=Streptomyces sp. NPDC001093 TaxID=3154376 RepID=UPI00332D1746